MTEIVDIEKQPNEVEAPDTMKDGAEARGGLLFFLLKVMLTLPVLGVFVVVLHLLTSIKLERDNDVWTSLDLLPYFIALSFGCLIVLCAQLLSCCFPAYSRANWYWPSTLLTGTAMILTWILAFIPNPLVIIAYFCITIAMGWSIVLLFVLTARNMHPNRTAASLAALPVFVGTTVVSNMVFLSIVEESDQNLSQTGINVISGVFIGVQAILALVVAMGFLMRRCRSDITIFLWFVPISVVGIAANTLTIIAMRTDVFIDFTLRLSLAAGTLSNLALGAAGAVVASLGIGSSHDSQSGS